MVGGNCGKFGVPGSGIEYDYAGVVDNSFEIRVGHSVKLVPSGLQMIEHPFTLLLLGANVFCRGEKHPVGTIRTLLSKQTIGPELCLDLLGSGVSPGLR